MDSVKIGIMTFHRAINYGALLQAYAFQEALKKMECDPTIIDYRSTVIEGLHHLMKLSDCRNLKDVLLFIFYAKNKNKKFRLFREFAYDFLNLSDPYETTEQLREIASEYDRFFCGSDQVWNCKITDFDKNYFLNFIESPIKKNAYAASFGISSIPIEYKAEYKDLLRDFNHISLREIQGKKLIKDMIANEPELVLDPTLLLTKQDWENIATDYRKKKDFILVYMFGKSTNIEKFVKKLSHKTTCDIVVISPSIVKRFNGTYEKCVGPSEFLGLFKNARYVVTNSFHGTCFSLNFNKEFFLEMLPESQGVNSRLENILDLFGLQSRKIINGENNNIHKLHCLFHQLDNRMQYNPDRNQ